MLILGIFIGIAVVIFKLISILIENYGTHNIIKGSIVIVIILCFQLLPKMIKDKAIKQKIRNRVNSSKPNYPDIKHPPESYNKKVDWEAIQPVKKHKNNFLTRPLCPVCNSKMYLREAKQGKNKGKKFWGCSRFPECKGTVDIKRSI